MAIGYTQEEFESLCNKVHDNKYDYSKVLYGGMDDRIEVICKRHGSFFLRAQDHYYQSHGCSQCYIEDKRISNLNSHESQISRKFNGNITLVDGAGFTVLRDTLTFNCGIHGDYRSQVASVKSSPVGNCQGCKTLLAGEEFITKSKLVHKDKYLYHAEDYISSRAMMKIYCTVHKEHFMQRPSAHAQGQGCPKCGELDRKETSSKDQDVFIKECKDTHGDKYDYTKTLYTLAHNKVTVTCPDHGDFTITPNNHINGGGCAPCGKLAYTYNKEKFIDESKRLYPDRLDYSKTDFVDRFTKTTMRCIDHNHEFQIKPIQHLGDSSGNFGCEHCGKINMGRWNIQTVRKIPHIESQVGDLYIGIVSGVKGFKIGVCKNLKSRMSSYNTDLRQVPNNFTYINSMKSDYISVFTIEYILKRTFSKYKVKHDVVFGGKNEMFDLPDKELNFVHDLLDGKYDILVNYFRQEFVTTKQDYTKVIKIINKLVEEN